MSEGVSERVRVREEREEKEKKELGEVATNHGAEKKK